MEKTFLKESIENIEKKLVKEHPSLLKPLEQLEFSSNLNMNLKIRLSIGFLGSLTIFFLSFWINLYLTIFSLTFFIISFWLRFYIGDSFDSEDLKRIKPTILFLQSLKNINFKENNNYYFNFLKNILSFLNSQQILKELSESKSNELDIDLEKSNLLEKLLEPEEYNTLKKLIFNWYKKNYLTIYTGFILKQNSFDADNFWNTTLLNSEFVKFLKNNFSYSEIDFILNCFKFDNYSWFSLINYLHYKLNKSIQINNCISLNELLSLKEDIINKYKIINNLEIKQEEIENKTKFVIKSENNLIENRNLLKRKELLKTDYLSEEQIKVIEEKFKDKLKVNKTLETKIYI